MSDVEYMDYAGVQVVSQRLKRIARIFRLVEMLLLQALTLLAWSNQPELTAQVRQLYDNANNTRTRCEALALELHFLITNFRDGDYSFNSRFTRR